MIRVGIAGCGKIAQVRHLPEYAAHPDAQIRGLYDLNQDRTRALAQQYQAKAYASFEEMLADPQLDAVSICAANASHASMSVAALKAGKHVLCEKPMATSLADCEEMVRAARENGKELMIGQNQRLAAAHVKAKELLDSGAIGRLITYTTSFRHGGPETWTVDPANNWFFDKKRAVMGAMADLGIHKTDLIHFLTGQTVTEVQAYLGTLDKKYADGSPIGVDDNAICIYRMSGGAVGTMTASWTDYCGEDNATVLFGTEGVMRIYEDPAHSIVLQKRGGETAYFDVDRIQTNDAQTKSGIIDLFVDHLLDPSKPFISGESVLTAMRAVFAALESAETGRAVRVNG
ncbi:MAG: Gfo/Idh/MocA family oxidoreductase [Clostridia bacterium]|nr:Gfo/Idh/MocA family oxidoreductase [Clostridia bacterium]MBR4360725.1 Gfo/Idh/MocA family oxidoreductase [Clostridia bacterium]